MKERIVISPELCDGCGICALVCAAQKSRQWHPALARIRVISDRNRHLNQPVTCAHCEDPFCVRACLMNVISKDPVNGLTIRRESYCIGCHACEVACPLGASCFDFINEVVVNCDLCKGEPVCVKYCPTGALQFYSIDEAVNRRREERASKICGDNGGGERK